MVQKTFKPSFQTDLVLLYGIHDSHLEYIKRNFPIKIFTQYPNLYLESEKVETIEKVFSLLVNMEKAAIASKNLSPNDILIMIEQQKKLDEEIFTDQPRSISILPTKHVKPKTHSQAKYIANMMSSDLVFGIGIAGTGKTYLAVAIGLYYLYKKKIDKLILTRPVIEAGESLGFLPGTFEEKIDPYIKPLYDAIGDLLSEKDLQQLLVDRKIELIPLAYMRGRTLSNSFIILDEAQNTTTSQMKMFLTRLGNGGKMVINGDISQTDLPRSQKSGLRDAIRLLSKIDEIKFCYFDKKDVVRHPLVQKILEKYEEYESKS